MSQTLKEVRRTIITSVAVIFIIGLPIAYIHEIGHGVICWSEGYKFTFHITALGGIGWCDGYPSNQLLYLAFGGTLAVLVTIGLLIIAKYVIKNIGLIIGLFTIMIGHITNIIMETFFYEFYINDDIWSIVITQLTMYTFWFYFVIRISKDKIKLTQRQN